MRINDLRLVSSSLLAYLLLVVSNCSRVGICDEKVIFEELSPDKTLKAVLIRSNCGATTSFLDEVFLVAVGVETKKRGAPVFKAIRTDGIQLSWQDQTTLQITYRYAQINDYTNYFSPPGKDPRSNLIWIREAHLRE